MADQPILTARQRVEQAAAAFPSEFGLRAFPGDKFRINLFSSYINDAGEVMLYTDVFSKASVTAGTWQNFSKATPTELRAELVEVK